MATGEPLIAIRGQHGVARAGPDPPQVALLVAVLAGLLNAFCMMRLPDIRPAASIEAAALA